MKVPFLDLKAQYSSIKEEVNLAVLNILENTSFILGSSVKNFENEFAVAHNVNYCYGLSNGTAGNHIVLWSLGIKPGDEVIIPANTFIATAWGVTLCGATPVFVDCASDTYNIDPSKVEAAITTKTKAIVAVHLYGQPADLDSLKVIADKHNLFLIEDAAQAHLAEYKGKKIGGIGKASSFSFYPGKNLGAYGEAGAAATNDPELAAKFKMIREHGAADKYYHKVYGHNYRMEGIQGAVLGVKLKYLKDWTEKRRNAAAKYCELLKDIDSIQLPIEADYSKHVYHLFVINVKAGKRDELQRFLDKNEISTGLHYPVPLHLQECFAHLGYKKGDKPCSENISENGLSLPIYPEISDDQLQYVSEIIHKYFK